MKNYLITGKDNLFKGSNPVYVIFNFAFSNNLENNLFGRAGATNL